MVYIDMSHDNLHLVNMDSLFPLKIMLTSYTLKQRFCSLSLTLSLTKGSCIILLQRTIYKMFVLNFFFLFCY
ncbi:hypothetical protein VNO77_40182 [Canavalia gladiata]|uniref:Uncharacterized protein n=1 Tax=Canavalia gladiata TaxID=3824 RepID=A0AAN9JY39_CANGL